MFSAPTRQFGVVKWFGGFNKKTERENNFGFVQLADGTDLYLHRKDWRGETPPAALDAVAFFVEARNDRMCCRQAVAVGSPTLGIQDLYQGLQTLLEQPPSPETSDGFVRLRSALLDQLHQALHTTTNAEVRTLCTRAGAETAASLYRVVSAGPHAEADFERLLEATNTPVTSDLAWPFMPVTLLAKYEIQIATELASEAPCVIQTKAERVLNRLSAPLLVLLLAKGGYTEVAQLGANYDRVDHFLRDVILDGRQTLPDYLQALAGSVSDWRWQCGNPLLQDMLDRYHFKKSLSVRGADFIAIYERSPRLQCDLQYFILYHLFSLIAAGNMREVVFNVLIQRLWDAFVNKQLTLDHQEKGLEALFPSCEVMGPQRLSCEAFFWRENEDKEEMFLCRGNRCYDPKVLPQQARSLSHYSIYDWLLLWGIDYSKASRPHSRDFPIRIAAYFNRLREIYKRLHCRSCMQLMVPNMKYARTFYKEFRNGVVETRPLSAAYRLTVFHCNDPGCMEHGNDYYINHCIGFNCRRIIDSRDLTRQCDAGRYICDICKSCCKEHGSGNRPAKAVQGNNVASYARRGGSASVPSQIGEIEARYIPTLQPPPLDNVPMDKGSSVPTLEDILSVPWPDEFR